MLDIIPTAEDMLALVGPELFAAWEKLRAAIEDKYDIEPQWNSGGKKWVYEYKYRRGGKTLCCLYAKENCVGLMIIFGAEEREKVEAIRGLLSPTTCAAYDEAATYHDGKWVMFAPNLPLTDLHALLAIKRKPNKK